MSWRRTEAGLVSGPRMLKIVRVPSSWRAGMTWRIAGWCIGAIMKPMPASASARSTTSGPTMTLTPSSVSASAAPDFDERLRLPCLATGTPAPATTKRGGGRDVERALAVAAGADDVDGALGGADAQALGAHHRGGAGVFGDGLAAGAQRHQEAADLRRAWRRRP